MDRASKYLPLQQFLRAQAARELPMSFRDVERVLGFALPPSARTHPAWWSNNRATNVAVKAWRDAGWRTSRVDMSGEHVTFIRDGAIGAAHERQFEPSHGVEETGAAFARDDVICVNKSALRGGAIRVLEDYCEAHGGTIADAAAHLLNEIALERRRQLLDWIRANAPKVSGDSADLIREDRDAR
jgi:hypothetical protein